MYHLNLWNENYNPWKNFAHVFDGAVSSVNNEEFQKTFLPDYALEETETHFLVSVDVPGMSKKDIQVEVKGNELHVSGERKKFGKFYRTFTLPENIKTEAIEAEVENGLLAIAIPKPEEVKPRLVKIGEGKSLLSKFLKAKEEVKNEDTKS